ncbi:MAG: type II toxin-antitoxin system HicB family antitoxin [Deltaproteobacteria bacterium]|nr:type II toxin-antitoxin system HicB family antitoxin [Deltaproteobacteria bacterium]MCL5893226.1 type II toxin-antitoxin system HicB family antitoxin [Deltaproteobacteria bacterium]
MKEIIKATFVKDGKWWVAYTDDIPGAMTQGKTIEEAEKNLIEVIKELESCKDDSKIVYEKVIDLKKAIA